MGLPIVHFRDLGKLSYAEAWELQQALLKELTAPKKQFYRDFPKGAYLPSRHYLLFVEHPHVYTLGKSGSVDHLLLNEAEQTEKDVEFFKVNRGGDITYHGPGQLVGYPIFDLDGFFTDVHKYVRFLEEAVIRTVAEYGLEGYRIKEYTGVWVEGPAGEERKICAIGVHLSRWVTMHGFAFNVNSDLEMFKHIVPCGIDEKGKAVTSLAQELGYTVDVEEVKHKVRHHLSELFGYREELLESHPLIQESKIRRL